MIDAARQYPQSSLNFIITAYWIDEDKDKKPEYYCFDRRCKDQYYVKNLCGTGAWPAGASECKAATPDLIAEFRDQLTTCFEHAVHRGFDIRVISHVDDGTKMGEWRNTLKLDPLHRYMSHGAEQYSYTEAVLFPVADALVRAARNHTKVRKRFL